MNIKNLTLAFTVILFTCFSLQAQNYGSISGYVYTQDDSLPLPGAHVYINTGQKRFGAVTEPNGKFNIKPIDPGTYTLFVSYVGRDTIQISGLVVDPNLNTDLGKKYLTNQSLPTFEFVYHRDLIDKDGGTVLKYKAKEMDIMPQKGDIKATLKAISSDFYVSERDQKVYFRGSRDGASAFYIDGMRVENVKLPGMGVGSMQVFAGGVPAMYGDFTGGVIVIETKSYSDVMEANKARDRYYNENKLPKVMKKKDYEKLKARLEELNK